jgi:hypothetical protein
MNREPRARAIVADVLALLILRSPLFYDPGFV